MIVVIVSLLNSTTYFKKSEHNETFDNEFHGQNGPLNVSEATDASEINKLFLQACDEFGIPENPDCNGAQQEGHFMYQVNVKDGERCSAAKAFITPNLDRPNLTVITRAHTEKVLFEGKRATGVQFSVKGKQQTVTANKEIIVSGGAFGSPQILMLSGVGPTEHLKQHNIDVVHDLPGVGQNLRDHIDYVQTYKVAAREDTFGISISGGTKMLGAMLEWRNFRTGKITSTLAESGAFFKSNDDVEIPDVQLVWVAGIVDDHAIVRDGICSLLATVPDIEVVAEAENGIETLEIARREKPDVIIMDIAMPDINGIEATRLLKTEMTDIKIVALSMHSDRRFVTEILKAGASAYVLKQSAFEDLEKAIKTVMMNRTFLSDDVLETVVNDYVSQLSKSEYEAYRQLSDRERQVLQLIAEGNSTKEIAFKLHVSVKTIESHRQNIMTKLSIHNLAGLTKFAVREGLTSLDG